MKSPQPRAPLPQPRPLPFLLVHHVSTGLALGMSAALVYLPFAQRSLILMFAR